MTTDFILGTFLLHSVTSGELLVAWARFIIRKCWAFSVVGPLPGTISHFSWILYFWSSEMGFRSHSSLCSL